MTKTTQAQRAIKAGRPGNYVLFQVLPAGAVRYVYADNSFVERRADGGIVCGVAA